ncbi:MAG: hypothetical protein AAFQ27_14320 [Pseudomonadota bacterium]
MLLLLAQHLLKKALKLLLTKLLSLHALALAVPLRVKALLAKALVAVPLHAKVLAVPLHAKALAVPLQSAKLPKLNASKSQNGRLQRDVAVGRFAFQPGFVFRP